MFGKKQEKHSQGKTVPLATIPILPVPILVPNARLSRARQSNQLIESSLNFAIMQLRITRVFSISHVICTDERKFLSNIELHIALLS